MMHDVVQEWDQNINFPNFNFNVTHHGDFVAIASEPLCLVGLDIVSHSRPLHNETIPHFIHQFFSYFSTSEWDKINAAANHCEMLNEFYRYWCVKESFVKAIGSGVGYRLDCVEFDHDNWTNISVKIDGQELKYWKFDLFELGIGHSVCIAKGHPSIATEDYKKTLKQTDFEEEDYLLGFNLPTDSFEMLTVEQLLTVFR
jgi:4'-phosphopantetheinyl transferase